MIEKIDEKIKMTTDKPAAHGGKRPGSGRKKGTLNKLTQTIKAKAAAHGDDALSTMIGIMNDGKALFAKKEVKVTLGGCGG